MIIIECTGFCKLEVVVQKHTLCAMYYVLFVLWRKKEQPLLCFVLFSYCTHTL